MTNVQALKNLYEQLGGSAKAVENITTTPEMIQALEEVASGGGGGGVLVVTAVPSGEISPITHMPIFIAEKTGGEVMEAIGNTKTAVLRMPEDESGEIAIYMPLLISGGGENAVIFGGTTLKSAGKGVLYEMQLAPNSYEVHMNAYEFALTS